MEILNLTQHTATAEQKKAGVIEPAQEEKAELILLLNIEKLPCRAILAGRAESLAAIAKKHGVSYAMIGGAPFLMPLLAEELARVGIRALHAFSVRESVDELLSDGSVRKNSIFKHVGFVDGAPDKYLAMPSGLSKSLQPFEAVMGRRY